MLLQIKACIFQSHSSALCTLWSFRSKSFFLFSFFFSFMGSVLLQIKTYTFKSHSSALFFLILFFSFMGSVLLQIKTYTFKSHSSAMYSFKSKTCIFRSHSSALSFRAKPTLFTCILLPQWGTADAVRSPLLRTQS